MTSREPSTFRNLTWHLPVVLAVISIVIAISGAAIFRITSPLLLLALLGGSFAVVFLAALLAIGLFVLSDPRFLDTVERAMNWTLERVFRPPHVSTGQEGLTGSRGVVVEAFRRSKGDLMTGRVRVSGESWAAIADSRRDALPVGAEVVVANVQGLTLIVTPCSEGDSQNAF